MRICCNPCPVSLFFILTTLVSLGCGNTAETTQSADTASTAPQETSSMRPVQLTRRTVSAMGTLFTLMIPDYVEEEKSKKAVTKAFDEIRRVEALMTTWDPNSYLTKVNQSGGEPTIVPRELYDIVAASKRISKRTEGKFDIAFFALGNLWQFKQDPPKLPDPKEIEKRLPLVDYESILLDASKYTIQLGKPGMGISLGAIAKGYGVDRAGHILTDHDIDDFIIYGGGDILFNGKKGRKPWSVGVQDPRDPSLYFARFDVDKNCAVVTSGEYEKFFVIDGKRYHHIIDPDTGYPAKGTVSVTVVAQNALEADALATGIFVLGPKKGMALIESDPKLEGIIVDDKLNVNVSSGLKNKVEIAPISQKPAPHPHH